jgi:putative transposase
MTRLFNGLLALLALATDRELARQVQYLKVENGILRGKLPGRAHVTAQEKERLLKFGAPLGGAIRQLISIVSPRTFLRWLHGECRPARRAATGRPRTPNDLRALVLRLARENAWGATRILGELKKLGLARLSRSTIANLLREAGLDPAPLRGAATWGEFLRRQAATVWACDIFTAKVRTLGGVVEYAVLFFLHIGSRRVHLAGLTARPDAAWVAEQARQTAAFFGGLPERPTHLIRDLDGRFTREFDEALAGAGVEVVRVGPRAPNLNAFAERWVLSVKSECLDHFLVLGESHLRYLLAEYLAHYHQHRPHQGLGNELLTGEPGPPPQPLAAARDVQVSERLGGLLKHYHVRAA